MSTSSMKHAEHFKSVLLLGSGKQAYREYALRSIGGKYPVTLVDACEPDWQKEHIAGNIVADLSVPAAVVDAVRLRGGRERFEGVVTYHEFLVELAATLAADLELPKNNAGCARRCSDKTLMWEAFEQHGG